MHGDKLGPFFRPPMRPLIVKGTSEKSIGSESRSLIACHGSIIDDEVTKWSLTTFEKKNLKKKKRSTRRKVAVKVVKNCSGPCSDSKNGRVQE